MTQAESCSHFNALHSRQHDPSIGLPHPHPHPLTCTARFYVVVTPLQKGRVNTLMQSSMRSSRLILLPPLLGIEPPHLPSVTSTIIQPHVYTGTKPRATKVCLRSTSFCFLLFYFLFGSFAFLAV
jgi:hypothetical protein